MRVFDAYVGLHDCLAGSVAVEEPLARRTSLGIGGPASLFITCDSLADIRMANDLLFSCEVPWVPMGCGTGVIAADAGFRGAVITLGRAFRRLAIDDDARMHVGAGVLLQRAVQMAFAQGLTGLEFAACIPGSVGGALALNASSPFGSMGGVVEEILAYRPGAGLVRYHSSEFVWQPHRLASPAGEVVLEATLQLKAASGVVVQEAMEAACNHARAAQPLGKLTCAPLFAEPQGSAEGEAGRLIASSGLAGCASGAAQLFAPNPNFVVNGGHARSDDVIRLIVRTLSEVKQRHGVQLQPEVKLLGFASA